MICLQCKKEFKAKRKTARFCSNACRLQYFRNAKGDETLNNETLTTKNNETLTNKELTPNWKTAKQLKGKHNPNRYLVLNDEKGIHGEDLVYCGKHRAHVKSYCETMCDEDCVHLISP